MPNLSVFNFIVVAFLCPWEKNLTNLKIFFLKPSVLAFMYNYVIYLSNFVYDMRIRVKASMFLKKHRYLVVPMPFVFLLFLIVLL